MKLKPFFIYMKTEKRTFVFHLDWADFLRGQPDNIRLAVYEAIIDYVNGGKEPQEGTPVYLVFLFIKQQIDKDVAKYAEICAKRAESGRQHKGNQHTRRMEQMEQVGTNGTNVPKLEQMEQVGTNGTDNEYEYEYEYDNDINNISANADLKNSKKEEAEIAETTLFDITDSVDSAKPIKRKVAQKEKHKWGNYQNVLLTDEEAERLKIDYGDDAIGIVENFSELKAMKGYKYKSDYLAIKKWGANAYFEQKTKHNGNIEIDRIVEAGFAMASAHGN